MAEKNSGIYSLAEPAAVDVSAIERELESLWRDAAHREGDEAVLRAAAFNLIYAMRSAADHGDAAELVATLALADPSRAILLGIGDEAAADSQEAWVTAYCHRPTPGSQQVCSEYIRLDVAGQSTEAVVSTLLSLRLSGVPTVLIWDASLPADHPLLTALGSQAERVITGVIPPCGPASSLTTFFGLCDALGKKPLTTDLLECFVRGWQSAIADLFDQSPEDISNLKSVHFHYESAKIPAEMLLTAAWISIVLDWRNENITLHGSHPTLNFEKGKSIEFRGHSDADKDSFIEFIIPSNQGQRVLRCGTPAADNRLIALLRGQLEIWDHNRYRDAAMERTRHWLKELLFA